MKINFEFDKETKNTLRYQEVGDDPKVQTLYLKKSAAKGLGLNSGDALVVTVEKGKKK